MRSIFTCTIAALILAACSQTSITSTPLPEFTPTTKSPSTPPPAETNTPSATATETNTPVPTAETAAIALFDKYNVDPATYTLAEVNGVIVGTDNETGTEIFRDGRFEINYAVELAKKDCEPTDFEPDKGGSMLTKHKDSSNRYLEKLLRDANYKPEEIEVLLFDVLVDRAKQCWAFADAKGDALVYRDETGLSQVISTFSSTYK